MTTDEMAAFAADGREAAPAGVTPATFKSVFRRHPAGVAVITFTTQDRPAGFTATSVISVSADPPVLAFSIDAASASWPLLAKAEHVAISFLAASQVDLSVRFATRAVDKFADGGWSLLPTGEPVLDGSSAWVRGEVLERTPVGRSYLVSVLVLEAHQAAAGAPLVYYDRSYHAIGDHSAI